MLEEDSKRTIEKQVKQIEDTIKVFMVEFRKLQVKQKEVLSIFIDNFKQKKK